MSDFAQTVSCDRLPQRMAARTERSPFTCSTSASSAAANFCWIDRGIAGDAIDLLHDVDEPVLV